MSQLGFDLTFNTSEINLSALVNSEIIKSEPEIIKYEPVTKRLHTDHKKEFIKVFKSISMSKKRYVVFSDFLTISVISLENSILKCEELECEYFRITKSYDKNDIENFSELLALIVMGLENKIEDFLGDVFMSLELGSADHGQFFTPFHISEMMSQIILKDADCIIDKKGYISIHEPTAGAGGMVIAAAKCLLDKGYNPQTQMLAVCTDIESDAANMCYIQLSLLGIPAIVNIGNSLTLKVNKTMYTPFYYLNKWRFIN
ncbi:N-6 DNA methylase [Morganella psychrotolerans]|uniref:N-6 DNA methylase n=1 Tax=Morganella psychrotolerans TaxID=368603 RepID=UPI0039B0B3A9